MLPDPPLRSDKAVRTSAVMTSIALQVLRLRAVRAVATVWLPAASSLATLQAEDRLASALLTVLY